MKRNWKRSMALLLSGVVIISAVPTRAFATETSNQLSATVTVIDYSANEAVTEDVAKRIAQEIINEKYYYGDAEVQEIGLGSAVKTVLKFIKNNWPKVAKILGKYGVIAAEGKEVTNYIDQLLNGVIEISDSIDSAIYAVVNFVAPNLSEDVKQLIVNAIRLISPV